MNLKRTIIAGSIFIVASLNANHVAMTNDFKVTVENKIINNPGYSWQNMVFKSVSQNDGSVLRELVLEGTDDGFSDRSFACTGIVVCKGQVFFCGYDRYFGVGVPPTIIIDGFIIGTANGVDLMAKVISDEYLRDIATDGDTLIVTGDNGFIATSTDAAGTWTDFNIGGPKDDYDRAIFANGKFYVINKFSPDNYKSYAVSDDGFNWEHRTGSVEVHDEPIIIHNQPKSSYAPEFANTILSLDASSDEGNFNIQWHADDSPIQSANHSDLVVTDDLLQKTLFAKLTNSEGSVLSDKVVVQKFSDIGHKTYPGLNLYTTGSNSKGQLGIGSTTDKSSYQYVRNNVIMASGGGEFSAFIDANNKLYATGNNEYGQLGVRNTVNSSSPVHVADNIIYVDCGTNHMLFVDENHTLWGVGLNSHSQLGIKDQGQITNPTEIAHNVVSAAAGETTSYYIRQDHKLFSIGSQEYGALGLGFAFNSTHVPVCVDNNVAAVTAGMVNVSYLKFDGTVCIAGQNHPRQFVYGVPENSLGVKKFSTNARFIGSGMSHSLYIDNDFDLFATGFNFAGAIGDGTNQYRLRPYLTASNVASVSSDPGSAATHYINHSGSLYAMGFNSTGALGDGSNTDRSRPVHITNNVIGVDSGSFHTLILKQPQTTPQRPAFLYTPKPTFVAKGDSLRLVPIIFGETTELQWFHSDEPMVDETDSVLSISNVTEDHGGVYRLEAQGPDGSIVSTDFISVYVRDSNGRISQWTPRAQNVVILNHPQSYRFNLGDDHRLSVIVTPDDNFQFQWFKNGVIVPGATQASLQLTNLSTTDAGNYHVVISNPKGEVTSNTAILALNTESPKESLLIRQQSGSMQLVMNVQVGQLYVLEESYDLVSWQVVDSFTAEQDSKSIDFSISKSQTFYRLRPIQPDLDVDLGVNNGGFDVETFGPVPGPWQYDNIKGVWYADGAEADCSGPYWSMLNSPAYSVIEDGNVVIQFRHRYSFEGDLWDGGQLRVSINGSEFEAIPAESFSANGYAEGQIIGSGILNGLEAFNGTSSGYESNQYITSIANLGLLKSGDSIVIQFLGGWDECVTGKTPNWEIKSLNSLQLSP